MKKFVFMYAVLLSNLYSSPSFSSGVLHKVLNEEVKFKPGEVATYKDEDTLYTLPNKTKHMPTESAKIYDQTESFIDAHESVKPGDDRRLQVHKTTSWPYRCFCQLSLRFPNGIHGGSGVLVGPQHVLTCAHNLYNVATQSFVDKITARFGLNGKSMPFGEIVGALFYLDDHYIGKQGEVDRRYDMALIVLSEPIGNRLGWCGFMFLPSQYLRKHELSVTGYPGDKGCTTMWTHSNGLKSVHEGRLIYDIDTFAGQSGSPIWIETEDGPIVIGIHTHGYDSRQYNSGTKISHPKFYQILEWMRETYEVDRVEPSITAVLRGTYVDNGSASSSSSTSSSVAQRKKPALGTGNSREIPPKTFSDRALDNAISYFTGDTISKWINVEKKDFDAAMKYVRWLTSNDIDGLSTLRGTNGDNGSASSSSSTSSSVAQRKKPAGGTGSSREIPPKTFSDRALDNAISYFTGDTISKWINVEKKDFDAAMKYFRWLTSNDIDGLSTTKKKNSHKNAQSDPLIQLSRSYGTFESPLLTKSDSDLIGEDRKAIRTRKLRQKIEDEEDETNNSKGYRTTNAATKKLTEEMDRQRSMNNLASLYKNYPELVPGFVLFSLYVLWYHEVPHWTLITGYTGMALLFYLHRSTVLRKR